MPGTPAAVTAFLAQYRPKQFCSGCIAFGLRLDLLEVRIALTTLAKESLVKTSTGICSACRQRLVTYGLGAREVPVQELICRALSEMPGPGVCQSCLASHLGLPLHDVQKAFWALRASGEVSIAADRCRLCDKLRLLMRCQEAPD